MSYVLQAEHLRRNFTRRSILGKPGSTFTAVHDVSLSIAAGQVHALLGPNGAGKTTTVRMCATLLAPTSGSITIGGVNALAHPQHARRRLGLVLGGERGFYPRASARDNLLFFADIAAVPSRDRHRQVAHALERVALTDVAHKKVQDFSRGMVQRLHIARALLGNPAVLLLDEPTSGLDPDISLTIRSLIRSLAQDGAAVLLTSHMLGELEELSHRVSVIGAGRIAATGTVADIAAHAGITATTAATLDARAQGERAALEQAAGDAGTVFLTPHGTGWELAVHWRNNPGTGAERIRTALESAGVRALTPLHTRAATLQEAYLALAEGLKR